MATREELEQELEDLAAHINERVHQEWTRPLADMASILRVFQKEQEQKIRQLRADIFSALARVAKAEVKEEDKAILDRIETICKSLQEG